MTSAGRRAADAGAWAARAGEDRHFMNVALMLGRRGLGRTWPNPAVGAVIVRDGVVVGRGWTQPGGRPHAEVEALREAGAAARGATLYVTLEPCSHHGKTPPCADAVVAAGIARVVSAMADPNPQVAGEGHARLRAAGIAVDVGEGAETARRDHAGHVSRVTRGRPHVLLKLAVSSDGRIGGPGGTPVAITGAESRARSHLLRARSDAILIGIGTALADDPLLTCRLPGMEGRSPVRVVLDRRLRLPLASRLVKSARATPLWVFTTAEAARARAAPLAAEGVEVIPLDAGTGPADLGPLLAALSAKGITRLTVEGGAHVATSFVDSGMIDEAWIFRAPMTIGEGGVPALDRHDLGALTEGRGMRMDAREALGADTLTIYRRD
jgi:diaminohydroxyphosphoribosylaminopyrimidine deaminase/5-amino-6-(5-phosphoribosylamino)uracil reductase